MLKACIAGLLLAAASYAETAARRPNIVFVFTDDQDYHHNSLDHMPALQEHLVAKGTSFTNHYATIAICCPSRVSLMRGQAAHNTNNTQVNGPGLAPSILYPANFNYFCSCFWAVANFR